MQCRTIAFIGGGNMAQALVFGLLTQGYPAELMTVCDPNAERRALFADKGVRVGTDNERAAKWAEAVVLAVKPQIMADVCVPLSAVDFGAKLVISIAAAISIEKLTALLPTAVNIVRVMPNTAAQVGAGMAGLFAQDYVPQADKDFAEWLLNAVGKTCWVRWEADMHSVTAGSGSAPAYFFLLLEAMQQTLTEMGLDASVARLLAQQSALGAATMAAENPQLPLSVLRENVTSKGGTTAAALSVFERQQFSAVVREAMQACVVRSQEMEQLFR